jgi:tetratricopeptide (TPR) repeat protein
MGVFAKRPEMSLTKSKWWLLWVVLPAGFAGVWQLQKKIDLQRAMFEDEQDEMVLRSAKLTKIASMEFAPLMADLYWTQAVQYYGTKRLKNKKGLDLLWPMLDIATALDPNLIPAYEFGGIFLAQKAPTGADRPDLAVQLMERGIRENPDYWRLYADLGHIYYFDLQNYPKASQAFLDGSRNPKAALWMKVMAARIAAIGNSMETSKFLWMEIYQSTKDEQIKKNAETHVQMIKVAEDCQTLDGLLDEFERRMGHRAKTTGELVAAKMLGGVPIDPLKYAYVIGENGKAGLNPQSPLAREQRFVVPNRPLLSQLPSE